MNRKPEKESDIIVSFPMKLAWQADCMFLFLRWKRSTWISKVSSGFVSIPLLKVGAPQEIYLRISPDHGLVDAIKEISIGSGVRVLIHGDPVKLFAICLFLVPADPLGDAPRKKKVETKYPGEW